MMNVYIGGLSDCLFKEVVQTNWEWDVTDRRRMGKGFRKIFKLVVNSKGETLHDKLL